MRDPAFLGYLAAALVFGVLTLLLLTAWRERVRGSLLVVACGVTVGWALVAASDHAPTFDHPWGLFLAEVLRGAAWAIVIGRLVSRDVEGAQRLRFVAYVLPALGVVYTLGISLLYDLHVIDAHVNQAFAPAPLLVSVAVLFLIEQAYRNLPVSGAGAIKLLLSGLALACGFDVFLFSITLLPWGMPVDAWSARGYFVALLGVPIAIGAARIRQWWSQLFVSRSLTLYTTSVFVAGAYFVVVALTGSYVRLLGGSWGGVMQVIFFALSVFAFVGVLSSGQMRATISVLVQKHLHAGKYDYRAEWMGLISTLTTASVEGDLHERIGSSLAAIIGARRAGLWVGAESGASYAFRAGDVPPECVQPVAADHPFVEMMRSQEWIYDLDALRRTTLRADGLPLPPGWLLGSRDAWLVVPLLHAKRLVGFVVLYQPRVSPGITWEDLDILRAAGRQAASYLALHEAALAVTQSKQFAAYNQFVAFVMHDLKNLVAQQTLVVRNAARYGQDPEFFRDAIETIDGSVKRMTRLLDDLSRGRFEETARSAPVVQLVREAVRRCEDRVPRPRLEEGAVDAAVEIPAERFISVLQHVIRNAQDATPPDGIVQVGVGRGDSGVRISVTDSGCGMEPAFVRDRLFRPFESTKGSQGMGIGAFQSREFVRAVGGDITVASVPGRGTVFVITLPESCIVAAPS